MHLLNIFILLQALSFSSSFDCEMEGVVKLGDGLLAILTNESKPVVRHEINVRSKSKLPKKISRSSVMKANLVGMSRSDEFIEFVERLKTKGVTTLRTVANEIFKGMNSQENFTRQIESIIRDYTATIQEYLEYVIGQKMQYIIDEELTFLDLVETACRLLYGEQKKILNFGMVAVKFIDDQNRKRNSTKIDNAMLKLNSTKKYNITEKLNSTKISQDADIQNMNQIIFMQGIKTKREVMRHICNKYEICRPYPAFTDYLADFIVEILKLPDEKLETFVKLLRILAKTNEQFFIDITEKKDKEEVIVPQLAALLNNLNGFQETLFLVRGLLTQRFKIIRYPNLKLKRRTQAVRILLDIVNQAFRYENDDLISMEFQNVVKNIRSWNNGQRHFPESAIISLANNIINVLDYNLSSNAQAEVRVLIETLIRGSSQDEELFRKLFSEGSQYVKGSPNMLLHMDLRFYYKVYFGLNKL